MDQNVTKPLLHLSTTIKKNPLAPTIHKAEESLRVYLDTLDPEFWRDYETGKVPASRGMQKVVKNSFGKVKDTVESIISTAENHVREKKDEVVRFEKKLETIAKESNELTKRIDNFDSPLGKLPVGVQELVAIFPGLILLFAIIMARAISGGLRHWFHIRQEVSQNNPSLPKHKLHLYASAWFIPKRYGANSFAMISWTVCMALLLLIYLRSCQLVVSGGEFITDKANRGNFTVIDVLVNPIPWVFLGLLLGAVFISTSRDLWRYSRVLKQ